MEKVTEERRGRKGKGKEIRKGNQRRGGTEKAKERR